MTVSTDVNSGTGRGAPVSGDAWVPLIDHADAHGKILSVWLRWLAGRIDGSLLE